jgi:hypothetical protein
MLSPSLVYLRICPPWPSPWRGDAVSVRERVTRDRVQGRRDSVVYDGLVLPIRLVA